MNYNKVIIAGNLTRDPELKYTPKGTAVCQFSLAINRTWTDAEGNKKEEVSFIDCVVWSARAETLAQYKKKGELLLVEGYLKQESWEDKETRQKRTKLKVVAENVQFGPRGASTKSDNDEPQAARPSRNASRAEAPQPDPQDSSVQEDDDVPF